ncbi:hypothetical protein I6B53_01980 [Schaalia sp. 19OD2882]|uniref:ABC transporter permease n=1 Tax=Schaalia sp. 19OD2882 TaxID=2794089 RepID=UPI001C1F15CE|nr:hypothetical protein [Schaalia sp. 19OD2882]QWW19911.1 hypothetical protein I6B53_01980 [Schaalia sp. 19OD2882]
MSGPATPSPLAGVGSLLALAARRRWKIALAWMVPMWALVGIMPGSYQDFYPALADRSVMMDQMRHSPGSRVLYGAIPEPGTIGQLTQWEAGTYIMWCTAIMALLAATALSRGDEQSGLVELARGSGAGRWAPPVAALAWVWGAVALLAAGVGGVLVCQRAQVAELTSSGALAMAGVIWAVGWFFAGVGLLCAQLFGEVGAARTAGFAVFGAAWLLRVVADEGETPWLRWLTPFGWRDLVGPYSGDHLEAVAVAVAAGCTLVAVAFALDARRELLAGCLPSRARTPRRLRVRGFFTLTQRLRRGHTLAWTVVAASTSAVFALMSSQLDAILHDSEGTVAWVRQMAGEGDTVVQFLTLMTLVSVLLVSIAAVSRVMALAGAERRGLTEVVLSAGLSRNSVFVSTVLDAGVLAAWLLVVSGGALSLVTSTQLSDQHAAGRALAFTVTQGVGVAAAIAVAAALLGLSPRLTSLVWGALAWSMFARTFGAFVDLPQWARDVSFLGHVHDPWGEVSATPMLVQAALALGCVVVGWWAYRCRDVPRA